MNFQPIQLNPSQRLHLTEMGYNPLSDNFPKSFLTQKIDINFALQESKLLLSCAPLSFTPKDSKEFIIVKNRFKSDPTRYNYIQTFPRDLDCVQLDYGFGNETGLPLSLCYFALGPDYKTGEKEGLLFELIKNKEDLTNLRTSQDPIFMDIPLVISLPETPDLKLQITVPPNFINPCGDDIPIFFKPLPIPENEIPNSYMETIQNFCFSNSYEISRTQTLESFRELSRKIEVRSKLTNKNRELQITYPLLSRWVLPLTLSSSSKFFISTDLESLIEDMKIEVKNFGRTIEIWPKSLGNKKHSVIEQLIKDFCSF